MPLILITNDDGVYSPGLAALRQALNKVGRTVVVAPETDNSAASHSLTMRRPLRVREHGDDIYSIDGTPTDCVTIGIGRLLAGRPDLVVSGINPGPNLGDDINYSGTVAAAKEGALLGVGSFAVSLAADNGTPDFEAAARFAARLAARLVESPMPEVTLLNVNIPMLPEQEIRGVRFTRQGRRIYDDAIKETHDPWGRKHYWIGGGTPTWDQGEDTDAQAVCRGYISITPLALDLTDHRTLAWLNRNWKLEDG